MVFSVIHCHVSLIRKMAKEHTCQKHSLGVYSGAKKQVKQATVVVIYFANDVARKGRR